MGRVTLADIEYAVIVALILVLVFAFVRAQYTFSDFEGRWTDDEGNMFVIERRGETHGPPGGSPKTTRPAPWGHRLRILAADGIRPIKNKTLSGIHLGEVCGTLAPCVTKGTPNPPAITGHAADVKMFRRICTADDKAACAQLSLDGRYLVWDEGADGSRRRWHRNGVL